MLESALALARLGLHVFPVQAGAKVPLPGFNDWQHRATTHDGQIRQWWFEFPGANIACHPGMSGHVVLDIDVKGGVEGFASLKALEKEQGEPMPKADWTAATPSGGAHLWFTLPPGITVKNSVGLLGPGLDTRSTSGYVLMPPSIIDGKRYRWVRPPASL